MKFTKEQADKATMDGIKNISQNYYHGPVAVKIEPERTKGKCLEGYEVIDNVVTIPRTEVTNAIKMYCSRHSIKIQRI